MEGILSTKKLNLPLRPPNEWRWDTRPEIWSKTPSEMSSPQGTIQLPMQLRTAPSRLWEVQSKRLFTVESWTRRSTKLQPLVTLGNHFEVPDQKDRKWSRLFRVLCDHFQATREQLCIERAQSRAAGDNGNSVTTRSFQISCRLHSAPTWMKSWKLGALVAGFMIKKIENTVVARRSCEASARNLDVHRCCPFRRTVPYIHRHLSHPLRSHPHVFRAVFQTGVPVVLAMKMRSRK